MKTMSNSYYESKIDHLSACSTTTDVQATVPRGTTDSLKTTTRALTTTSVQTTTDSPKTSTGASITGAIQ